MTGIANHFVTGQVFRTKVQELTLRGLRSEETRVLASRADAARKHQVELYRLRDLVVRVRISDVVLLA